MTEEELRERIRGVVHGAVKNYIQAHGMEFKTATNVNSLEKRIVGGVLSAIKTGQWEGYSGQLNSTVGRADCPVHTGSAQVSDVQRVPIHSAAH